MAELKKTSVQDFVKSYSSAPNKQARTKLCEDIIERKYVPILEKYSVLLIGFNRSVRDANGLVMFNSVMQYIMYVMLTLKMYTNLDIGDEKASTIDAYDMLRECGAIDQILLAVGEDELKEIERINQAIITDVKENELNPYTYVAAQINKMRDTGKELVEMLYGTEILEQFRSAGKELAGKINDIEKTDVIK